MMKSLFRGHQQGGLWSHFPFYLWSSRVCFYLIDQRVRICQIAYPAFLFGYIFDTIRVQQCTLRKMNTPNNTRFEGFKGEVFKTITQAGEQGITFKQLKDIFVSTLLDDSLALDKTTTPNLHATLLVLTNGGHVSSTPARSVLFEDNDVFRRKNN